jgi:peptidoglycan/xylan/chitin deacetylase (PgdA/CDA1 family)
MTQRLTAWLARLASVVGLVRPLLHLLDRWRRRPEFPFLARRRDAVFQVLIYHRVNDDGDPFFAGMPVTEFRRQMQVLARRFHVLPLAELVHRAARGDLPPRAVAVTFDDGYRDNHDCAFPVLSELGLPATVFLTTGSIGTGAPLWHDRVFQAFRTTTRDSVELHGRRHALSSVELRRAALRQTLGELRRLAPPARDASIAELIERLQVDTGGAEPMLSWDEIRRMRGGGVSFGAHTVSHPILTRLPLEAAVREIATSKTTIEEQLGEPVELFAYPNGGREDFDEAIKEALREAGFLCAVTTLFGSNDRQTDPFELRRLAAWDARPDRFALRLGWYRFRS